MSLRLFDSHTHYTEARFDEDREQLLSLLPEAGIEHVIACPSTPEESEECLALADRYPFIYAAVGLHPHECAAYGDAAVDTMRKLAAHPKCVAIGETGLDYHYDFSSRETQRLWFHRMCLLAVELDKPVIVHDRESHADVLDILKKTRPKGVIHCYSGSTEMAEDLVKMGFYISFSGSVTFKNASRLGQAAATIPADRLLIETDCPYLAPEPVRGKRNDSRNVHFVAEKLALLRGVSAEEIIRITNENAKNLFKIG